MKKIIIILLTVILLTGCTKETQSPTTITEFYPIYQDTNLKLGLMFNTIKATLGTCNNTHNETSIYDGSSATVYEYDTLEIETYIDSGTEKVYSINFTSPEQETKEGLKIGDSKEKMLEIYQNQYTQPLDNVYVYNIEHTNLSITTENDIIIGIRYYLS